MPPRRAKEAKAGNAGALTITAQQSRFHTEMDEDNNLKEIVVKDLSISIGNRELLSHANFQLQRGRHYVLHGRNGIGKSTLLRAIATDQIPSIPRGVRVLLLGQTISNLEEDVENLDLNERTVLEYVVRSDTQRELLLHEANTLEKAIENSADPIAGVRAYRRISHERLGRKLEQVRQIALRRSGGRGADAKKVLLKTEAEFETSKERLEGEIGASEMGEESQKAAEMLVEVQTSLELMDAAAAETKARSILIGLGFSEDSLAQPRSHLSGGWRTRCSLACALCQSPDLLLLDEPTNFLDLPSIIWLERYVQELTDTTVMVVTHDRSFGDSVAEELLVLRNQTLERFKGNLSSYEMDRLKTYKHMTRLKDAQDKQKKHIQSTIDGNVAAAKRAGDDKKLKQAASRKKKLDDRMGLQVSAKGTRFKLNRDRVGYYADGMRNEIDVPTFDPPATMVIPAEPSDLRFPGSLVSFEKVNFSYTSTTAGKKKTTQILTDIDLTIQLGDRIGIAGLNGSGKSTLVSLAMGVVTGDEGGKAMLPTSGTVARHTRAKFALYSQQAAEELDALAGTRPELTALSHLMDFIGETESVTEQEARGLLSGVGLVGKIATDVPIALLSGGQRVRLALAKIFADPPHLLILDEVTTHLDTDTIQALVTALKSYEGAIVVVTHDRFFMRCVVEGESMKALAAASRPEDEDGDEEDEDSSDDDGEGEAKRTRVVYRLSKGKLSKLARGMEQYEEIAARSATKLGKA